MSKKPLPMKNTTKYSFRCYAGLDIKPDGMGDLSCVTYSGPTIVGIRSGKHDTPDAESHACDLDYILQNEIFRNFCKTSTGMVKPVLIISTEGGPDENPRYEKVIKFGIQYFISTI